MTVMSRRSVLRASLGAAAAWTLARPYIAHAAANPIEQWRQIPHRSTPASVRTPPRFPPLEAFRTPASVHARTSLTGRRPKTLNDSGHSRKPRYNREGPAIAAALIVLVENNIAARAIHGMNVVRTGPKRFANEP